ncbi:MAG: hypothetical protein FD156_299 [Nitrospirae bacterium]|nr:MAG: hypothetical protein FD156_299 [Nitrospirota bacterium]
MKINGYSFGKITVDGKTYTSDVVIYPERVDSSWWRKEGHYLQPVDLEEIFKAKPDILIIGAGHDGVMRVPDETLNFIKAKRINVYADKTGRAVEEYNRLQAEKTKKIVVAALHLTC